MKIAYDIKLMRPGCVLLQAALGCRPYVAQRFDTQDWLLAPTPDLRVYNLRDEFISLLVQKTRDARKDKHEPGREDQAHS